MNPEDDRPIRTDFQPLWLGECRVFARDHGQRRASLHAALLPPAEFVSVRLAVLSCGVTEMRPVSGRISSSVVPGVATRQMERRFHGLALAVGRRPPYDTAFLDPSGEAS